MTSKQKIIGAIVAIGIALIAIFFSGFPTIVTPQSSNVEKQSPTITQENAGDIKVLSMNPKIDSNTYLTPLQPIELTFSEPLENRGELKVVFAPEIGHDVQLSNDRKTAKIIPGSPYPLDQDITLMIKGESKFDGGKKLDRELIYHFRTIAYKGV